MQCTVLVYWSQIDSGYIRIRSLSPLTVSAELHEIPGRPPAGFYRLFVVDYANLIETADRCLQTDSKVAENLLGGFEGSETHDLSFR